jgi:ABC-type multidrug transport system fused ATPase/permease subunit
MALTVLAALLQLIIDASIENVASVCIVLASSLILLLYLGWTNALQTQPLSTFAIFGFCATTQLGALLAQAAVWTPLRASLYDAVHTFGTLAFYQAIAVVVHVAYRFFAAENPGARPGARPDGIHLFRGVLRWAGLYRTPSSGALWFMGCVGLMSFFGRTDGVLGKVASAFNFLTWCPFLIPFYLREVGESYCNARRNKFFLAMYMAAVAVLGIALNARQIMFVGVLTVGLLYFLAALRSKAPVTQRALFRLGALAALLLVVAIPISNFATSMAVARQWRDKVSPVEMIATTYQIYRRPALIAAYRAEGDRIARFAAYDEHYIMNPGVARFVSTKYHDNALHFAAALKTDDSKARLRDISIKFLWAAFPAPMLHALGVAVDKDALGYSMGDYLAYLSRGVPLGGRKIGSMFAQGIALMGPFFPFVYAVFCLAFFGVLDLLTIRSATGVAALSSFGMLGIWGYFSTGLSYEALHHAFDFFARNLEQSLTIYLLVFALARWVTHHKRAGLQVFETPSSLSDPASPLPFRVRQ